MQEWILTTCWRENFHSSSVLWWPLGGVVGVASLVCSAVRDIHTIYLRCVTFWYPKLLPPYKWFPYLLHIWQVFKLFPSSCACCHYACLCHLLAILLESWTKTIFIISSSQSLTADWSSSWNVVVVRFMPFWFQMYSPSGTLFLNRVNNFFAILMSRSKPFKLFRGLLHSCRHLPVSLPSVILCWFQ